MTKAKKAQAAKVKSKVNLKSKGKAKASPQSKSKAKKTAAKARPAKKKTEPKKTKANGSKTAAAVKKKTDAANASSSLPKRATRSKVKMLPRDFLIDLAKAIRDAVLPATQGAKGREIIGQAVSGDATFELDRIAEKALLAFLKQARMPVAYYSEDEGYATFSSVQPQNLLIVDPIDGTRAAKSGFEGCVIAIASTRVIERPRMADVDSACVMEIMGDRIIYAARDKGARMYVNDHLKRPKLSKNATLETVSWSMTVPGRPAELIFPTAARLIDLTSLKGGFFACNSTSFSLTRLLTNQLDACVDFANRFYRDVPELVRDHFINAGRGAVLGIAPYDLAASLLIAQEAGCTVTDAYGGNFDDMLLLDSSEGNQRSVIAAANEELHAKLLSFFGTRIKQLELLLKRRAEQSG